MSSICESSQAFLVFLWPWQFWRLLIRYFVELFSVCFCLMFSHNYPGVMGFGDEYHRDDMCFSSHFIWDMWYHNDLLVIILMFITGFKIVSARLLSWKVTIFPFHTWFFGIWSLFQSTLKGRGINKLHLQSQKATYYLTEQMFLILIRSNLSFISHMDCAFGVACKNHCQTQDWFFKTALLRYNLRTEESPI